jgi:hypothetical protein
MTMHTTYTDLQTYALAHPLTRADGLTDGNYRMVDEVTSLALSVNL